VTNQYYIQYFTHKELACKQTGKLILAQGFADRLTQLRIKFNRPMIVTSCCRSKEYNAKVGGSYRSFHVYDHPYYKTGGSCAIDVAMNDGHIRGKLISLAWRSGWSIGVNKKFVHLDRRIDYTNLKQIIFLY